MFWKKKAVEAEAPAVKAEPSKMKAKKLSPRDNMRQQIEQLTAGQVVRYKFPETFGGNLAVIELNPRYPQKGHKYILSTEKLVGGKSAGKKSQLFDSNNPGALAGWVLERMGELFVVAEKGSEEPGQTTKQPPLSSTAS
jgi:hypothetical protein